MRQHAIGTVMLGLTLLPLMVQAAPERVVSIGGHVTEIVYALGAQHRLVGTDSSSIYPEAAKRLPQVGYLRQVSVEGVVSLQPDLIIASHDLGPPAAVARLKSLNIPLVLTGAVDSIDSAAARIRQVSRALDLDAEGERLAVEVETKAREVSARWNNQPGPRPKVALFLGHGSRSPLGAGSNTTGDAMIRLAGGDNALASMQGFKAVPAESLIQAAPDVIVLTRQSVEQAGSLAAALRGIPGVEHTPAGRAGRVLVMDIMALFSFGPRLPAVLDELGAGIHAATRGDSVQ